MAASLREAVESPQEQGADESIAWTLDITNWGDTPTDIVVRVEDEDGADVTATATTGSPVAVTSVLINCPRIHSLTIGKQYTVYVKFTVSTQILEAYFVLICEE